MAVNGACAAFLLTAAVAAQLRPTLGREGCPLGAAGGRGYRWPRANPALVAPVSVTYDYKVFRNPLEAEMTGEAISIKVPPDMFASFNMTDAKGAPQEQYVLRSMELRKPGQLPEGSSQVLSHVLELVLVHEDVVHKDTWATVVLPFAVAVDPATDLLSSLLAGSRLPENYGQREALLMRAAQPLDLEAAFKDVAFLAYWTTLPTRCPGGDDVPARQLLRNSTLDMSQSTFATALRALQAAPVEPPLQSPQDAFLVGSCPVPAAGGSPCKPMEAEDLSQPLLEAQTLQAQALSNLRAKKGAMDVALVGLENASQETYRTAVMARDALRNAEAELDAAASNVARYEEWQAQAQSMVWSPIPPRTAEGGAKPEEKQPASGAALLAASRARRGVLARGGADKRRGPLQGDCLAQGLSPIAITSAAAVKQAIGTAAPQPVMFVATSERASNAELQAFNTGEYVRIVAPPRAGAALGSFSVGGLDRAVTFADLHAPGEHTVDGRKADAELQLVHLPKGGGPAIAVSFLLDASTDGTNNTGLAPFLAALPRPRSEGPARAGPAPLAAMHAADRYFRYNGTLTRSPCRVAEWFVLEERGVIGPSQLAALRAALPDAAASAGDPTAPRPPFAPLGLVLRDVQALYDEAPRAAPVLAHAGAPEPPTAKGAAPAIAAAASADARAAAGVAPAPEAPQQEQPPQQPAHGNRLINLLGQFRRSEVQQHPSIV